MSLIDELRVNPIVWILLSLTLVACSRAPGSTPHEGELRSETALDSVVVIDTVDHPVPEAVRLDTVLDLQRRQVEIEDKVSLYMAEEGSGPALVLINGGPGNSFHSFLPHFSNASSFAHVIYYDQRGTGLSDWVPGAAGYSTAQAVDDLERLRLALDVERWFVLGHSYGGVIAQWYAMRHPEHLLGLVLVGSSVPVDGLDLGERDYRSEAERRRIREVYAVDGQAVVPVHSDRVDLATLQRMIYNGYLNGDWKRQYFFKPSRERMAQIARYEWLHDRNLNRQVTQDGFSRDLRGVFQDFPVPTLIIEGRHDAVWGSVKPALLASEHLNAELVIIEQASHFPFAEQPSTFFGRLEAFVRTAPSVDPVSIAKWKDSVSER